MALKVFFLYAKSMLRVLLFLLLFCQIEAAELVLYYSPYCPYSRQVITHLQKVQCQVSLKNVVQDPLAKEELKKWGGRLEVPCLLIDGEALYNSDAIIEWLDSHQSDLKS